MKDVQLKLALSRAWLHELLTMLRSLLYCRFRWANGISGRGGFFCIGLSLDVEIMVIIYLILATSNRMMRSRQMDSDKTDIQVADVLATCYC